MITLESIDSKLDRVVEDVGVLKSHVTGNGVPGLVGRMAKAENDIAQVKGAIHLMKWGVPVLMGLGPVVGALATIIVRGH